MGKLIVLTRSEAGNRAWAPHVCALGLPVYELPTIQTQPVAPTPAAKTTLEALSEFDWIVFTSGAGVRYLHELATELGLLWPPAGPRIAVIGNQTKRAAEAAGLRVGFQPTEPNSLALGRELPDVSGKRVLIPRTTITTNELPALLIEQAALVTTLPVYETRTIDTPDRVFLEKLNADEVGLVVFGSPSAVRGFLRQVTEPFRTKATAIPVVAIGPGVADALRTAGFLQVHTSPEPSIVGVVKIIQQLTR